MRVELLVVGAHNGEKLRNVILEEASKGLVILVEPVPYLFSELSNSFGSVPNVTCLDRCIAPQSGKVKFYAVDQAGRPVCPWADQLGSMDGKHAITHIKELAPHVTEMDVDAISFIELVEQFQIDAISTLIIDTEGYDAKLLPLFPFTLVRPEKIIFEHKHSDGTYNIGRNLGRLLIALDELGYNISVLDIENCMATKRQPS